MSFFSLVAIKKDSFNTVRICSPPSGPHKYGTDGEVWYLCPGNYSLAAGHWEAPIGAGRWGTPGSARRDSLFDPRWNCRRLATDGCVEARRVRSMLQRDEDSWPAGAGARVSEELEQLLTPEARPVPRSSFDEPAVIWHWVPWVAG